MASKDDVKMSSDETLSKPSIMKISENYDLESFVRNIELNRKNIEKV